MLLIPNIEVKIGKIRFNRVNECTIVKSAELLENTAIIKIPRSAIALKKGELSTFTDTSKRFKSGDEVLIKMGVNGTAAANYEDGTKQEEFRGYVRHLKVGYPVEIVCEDQTWILKHKNLVGSFKKTTLKALLEWILKGTGIKLEKNVPVINFDKFIFRNVTAAQALQKLKEKYGLTIYFKSWNLLFVGIAFEQDTYEQIYQIGKNVVDDSLEIVDESDTRMSCKAILITKDNKRIEKEVGNPLGEKRTLYFYNISPSALESIAKKELVKYKYTGLKGSFNTFLIPNPRLGQRSEIRHPSFPDKNGKYLTTKIETTLSESGARRKIFIGLKVSVN